MGICLFLLGVVTIVCGDVFHSVLRTKTQQHFIHHILFLKSVPVDFSIKIIPQSILPPNEGFFRLLLANIEDQRWHFSKQPARSSDDILGVLLNQLLVDSGNIIETVRIGLGAELGQFVVTCFVFGQ